MALGLVNVYLYMRRAYKYEDEATGFYNPMYLQYIKLLEEKGLRKKDVIISISGEGEADAIPKILRQELPKDAEVLHMGGNKYLMFAEGKSRQFADLVKVMLRDAVEEYNEHNPEAKLKLKTDLISKEDI